MSFRWLDGLKARIFHAASSLIPWVCPGGQVLRASPTSSRRRPSTPRPRPWAKPERSKRASHAARNCAALRTAVIAESDGNLPNAARHGKRRPMLLPDVADPTTWCCEWGRAELGLRRGRHERSRGRHKGRHKGDEEGRVRFPQSIASWRKRDFAQSAHRFMADPKSCGSAPPERLASFHGAACLRRNLFSSPAHQTPEHKSDRDVDQTT